MLLARQDTLRRASVSTFKSLPDDRWQLEPRTSGPRSAAGSRHAGQA